MKPLMYVCWLILLSQQVFSQTITWTGATDTNWSTASNWSTNTAPTNANKVNIPGSLARYPVLNTNVSIQNLVVEVGATLTVNASKELTINGSGNDVVLNVLGTVENNGTITVNQITSTTANAMQLSGNGQFNNNSGATLSAATIGFYGIRVEGNSVLLNQVGGTIGAAGFSGSVFLSGSASPESVQNHGKMTLGGQIEKYAGTFHNYPCGVVKLSAGEVYNNGGQILNEGFFSAAANLNGTAANFINNGIIYIGGSSASYTNNAIRIFNNATTTSIFEFAASNNLTVEGIYKNDAATTSAGGYNQATNTFTHFGLAAGSQTLYAKITRPGGTCPQIVLFTFEVSSASTFTTQPSNQTACTGGSAEFMVAIANAVSYQWQLNTGSGWNNVPAAAPYSNTTTATLNISNVAGLNGYQYRCFVTGSGGATLTSNAATLTISAGGASTPTGTITWTGSVDTDWNIACNWSPASVPTATNDVVIPNTTNKPTINTAAVAKSVEVRAGAILTIAATKSLTTNSAFDFGSGRISFLNLGTVQNNGRLVVDNSSLIIGKGVVNGGLFYNNSNAEISINKTTGSFLENAGGTFTNVSKITIDASSAIGGGGICFLNTQNGVFNNNEGGEMVVVGLGSSLSFSNDVGSTVTNKAKITLIDNGIAGVTLSNGGSLTNTSLGEISITSFVTVGLLNNVSAVFNNAGKLTVGANGTSLGNQGIFNNNVGGDIKVERGSLAGISNTGNFTNSAKITILATVTGDGLENTGTLTNNACATLLVLARNYVNGVGGVTTNAGLIQVANSLQNNGTFTNNGVLKYGSLTGTVTNTTNSSLIVNNTPTPIFTYGGSYDGVINGIFTAMSALPGESAGAFTAPNTFVPSGLPSGSQTLYAKITPQGGACSFVVPFTYDGACSLVSTPTGLLTWTGSVDTDWNTACNWSPASVPTATNDVVIPNTTNKPTINTAAVAKSVEVQTGAVLTIAATKSLTINGSRLVSFVSTGLYNAGTIHNNGQLVLGNTGSVGDQGILSIGIFNNNTGAEITVDRATSGGVDNATGGVFANAGKMTIGASASVGPVGLQNDATFNNNTGGEITINRSSSIGLNNAVGGTFTNAAKISIGTITPTLANGLYNTAAFINNAGGEITINNTTAAGLVSASDNLSIYSPGTFTNAGKISIGSTALRSIGLSNSGSATFNNNAGGEINIDRSTLVGLKNDPDCIFNNAAKITIGATAGVGNEGIRNFATFNNNTGGEIKIDNSTQVGLYNLTGATFTNAAKLSIGASANVGIQGIVNDGTFNNNVGGELTIDRSTQIGIFNQHGTFTNAAKLTIGGIESVGERGIVNYNIFSNNAGGDIKIDKASKVALESGVKFTNSAKITVGATSGSQSGLLIGGTFDNTTGGEIMIDRTTLDALLNSGSSFNNAGKITIGALASLGTTSGFGNVNTFNNNACGQVIVASGTVLNDASGSITNAGFVQIANNLENIGTFTNNGVLKYGTLTGTVTNATNSSLIVNNTPTPIFTYGGSYDGVINGIFTDANATVSAGAFTAPNTFAPSGLPAGTQTLYVKITPQGGACSFVVPFTFNNTALAPVFTTQPTAATRCAGSSVSFTAAATNATGYQWQLSTGGGWSNVPASAPYANTTTGTLAISDVTGLNGYQFRCVAIGATSNINSDPASLTVVSKPTITLTALTQTLVEGNNPILCDTDANPVNSLQFSATTGCVVGTPVWRVQVGNGAWSAWSATAPVSQPSNNQPHRYQAACDASCTSTYSRVIELTINYRASTPQNVSLLVDGVTVKEGETKEICSGLTTSLTFNASCAAGELALYSVDGGEYSSVVPTSLVDNQFHNYRVRCRKSDGTASCVESESGVMRLKIVSPPAAPMVSLSSSGSCTTGTVFSGQSSCGSSQTIWYNATTNAALPNLPTTFPLETTSYYARCQTSNGCLSEKSNVVTFTVTATYVAPVITASQEIVCTGATVTISANCPAGSQTFWNTGVTTPSFQVAFNNVTKQTYWAKCIFEGGCQSSESVRKDIYWNAFVVTMINVGQSKSAIKPANDKALWSSQFITKDGGPELEQSTQVNPTLYYVENPNKVGPRYWTINVDACGLGTEGSLTFDLLATPETGVPQSFNTHENNAPYFMYANREGWTELYAQNHPAYGFYQDNGAGGNVYDAGLPKALYKLSIRYWDQKGWGSIYPSTRKPQGNVLAYQEYWFRIQSKDGVGTGAARVGDSGEPSARELFVLPNPVSNILRLHVGDSKGQAVQTTLTDASGRRVLSRVFVPETNSHQEELGVSELPTGMYFLQVTTPAKQATLKVVKVE